MNEFPKPNAKKYRQRSQRQILHATHLLTAIISIDVDTHACHIVIARFNKSSHGANVLDKECMQPSANTIHIGGHEVQISTAICTLSYRASSFGQFPFCNGHHS